MEGSGSSKRMRVYCPEPNKIAESMFARKYVNYIVPALMKMKQKSSNINSNTSSSSIGEDMIKEEEEGKGHKNNSDEDANANKGIRYEVEMAMVVSAQGFAWSNALKLKLLQNHHEEQDQCCDDEDEDNEDDELEEKQMKKLRRLIPGGEHMSDEKHMASELKSYISCLQMQVNILHCLAHSL